MSHEPPQAPDFSVIIVSYNTRDMTLDCLASVYAQTTGAFEVVVVDNASSDGSAEAIGAAFPQVKLIAETVNHGFAAAHHVAVPHCRAPWLVLLNPDTVVLDGALDRLMAFRRQRPEAGIWGGRTVFADGRLNPASCWRRQTPWSLLCRASGLAVIFRTSEVFNPESYGGWPRDSVREVDIVTGCLFLIGRESWDRLGGFDPGLRDVWRRGRSVPARAKARSAPRDHPGGDDHPLRRRLGKGARRQAGAPVAGQGRACEAAFRPGHARVGPDPECGLAGIAPPGAVGAVAGAGHRPLSRGGHGMAHGLAPPGGVASWVLIRNLEETGQARPAGRVLRRIAQGDLCAGCGACAGSFPTRS